MKTTSSGKLTIGADPELFLINSNGKFISSIGLMGGTKKKPLPIGNRCAIQEDNVAVEFNIAPQTEVVGFIASCNYALKELTKRAAEKGLLLSITASKSFDDDQLDNNKARQFGCDADFNAWTRKMNKKPNAADPNLRSCGGHIHIGAEGVDKIQLVRWCDVFLGLPSVFEDPDKGRRQLYGAAGCFRPKAYGIEYRSLSNYWLQAEETMTNIWNRTQQAVAKALKNQLNDRAGRDIQSAINGSDATLAMSLMEKYG